MAESLWNKYDTRKSPDVPVKRSPKVSRRERVLSLNDSTATGCKIYELVSLFTTGCEVFCGAGVAHRAEDDDRYEAASVLTHSVRDA